ncbi:MAG: hypothetical protein J7M24_01425, partial [Candidatus Latescibacteria bacterium]|nr:hypothetical protein [Candidatus Latescibacterota bacterium]
MNENVDEGNGQTGKENEDDVFDYNDLINDFTRDDADDAEEPVKSLDDVDVSELIDKSVAESEAREPEKSPEENIADIFDELDEKARSSIFEDADESGESFGETSAEETDGDAGENEQYTLEKSIDEDEGDYASILSQLEGGGLGGDGYSSGGLAVSSDAVTVEGEIVPAAGGSEDDFSFDALFDASGEEESETVGETVPTDEGTVEEILSMSDSGDNDLPEEIYGAENETAPETGDDQSFEDILGVDEFVVEEPAGAGDAASAEEPPVNETVGGLGGETAEMTDAATGEPLGETAESHGDDDAGFLDDIPRFGDADAGGVET